MDSTLIRDLNTHSKIIRDNPIERKNALNTASAIGNWKRCDNCGKIMIRIRHVENEQICRTRLNKISNLSTVR